MAIYLMRVFTSWAIVAEVIFCLYTTFKEDARGNIMHRFTTSLLCEDQRVKILLILLIAVKKKSRALEDLLIAYGTAISR